MSSFTFLCPVAHTRRTPDASDFAVGAVLEQEISPGVWKVIAYFSPKLQNGQVNWSVQEKETYALVTALLKFEPWVGGSQVVVVNTDGPQTYNDRKMAFWRQ